MSASLLIQPGQFTLDQLRAIYQERAAFELDPSAREVVAASQRTVSEIIANQRTVYGINTGFGLLARTSIARWP
jgi:histidine ammonia-lyase